jgi:phosphodiesterase/alkaline phosphatase D-like protein
MTHPQLTRRHFLAQSAALSAGVFFPRSFNVQAQDAPPAAPFTSNWQNDLDRPWLGAAYWANPLQDWQVKNGRAECLNAAPDRNIHVLTRELADRSGDLTMSVSIGRVGGGPLAADGKGSAGFKVAVLGNLRDYPEHRDYRNNLAFSEGIDCGFTAKGTLFWGTPTAAGKAVFDPAAVESVRLTLSITPQGATYTAILTAFNAETNAELATLTQANLPAQRLLGNLAVGCNFGRAGTGGKAAKKAAPPTGAGNGLFWFSDWQIAGSKVVANEDHQFGPILFNQYTLSNGVLRMTAQMPPLAEQDHQKVTLEIERESGWAEVAQASLHPLARTATVEVKDWTAPTDVPYRLVYVLKSASGESHHYFPGTIRHDPVDVDELKVADISCNIHTAFPNAHYVANVGLLNPDLLAFVGDQFYESTAGYGVQRSPLEPSVLDYLRKWYFHGWTWRELTRDRPSIAIPDDHDVYQGNIWGEGGAPQTTSQEAGGYQNLPEWVNVVHHTQTAHHPLPYDPVPGKQGITHYYGPLTYGGISFAILADRQYKSAPEGKVPPTDSRGDHVINPAFDPKVADLPGLELMGEKQLQFIREWTRDWRGAEMKAIISQTVFVGMATTHGGEREVLRIDYDQNGWPQAARNAALREIRKSFSVHLAGDQHLPAVVHYGIDSHRDAGVAYAGPAVNVGYPRWWEPTAQVNDRKPGQGLTGDFKDHFGHPMTVLAVANGPDQPPQPIMAQIAAKTSGFGWVVFNKKTRAITIECWQFGTEFGRPSAAQMNTWPVKTTQLDQYARQPTAFLPKLSITGTAKPLVEVFNANDELVYALRLPNGTFQPHVFDPGPHQLRVSEPETGREIWLKALQPVTDSTAAPSLSIALP